MSKIREGEKINTKNLEIIKPSIQSRLYRTFILRETRVQTIEFVKDVFNNAINTISYYSTNDKNNFNKEIVQTLNHNIEYAVKGLRNLIVTYEEDMKFITDMESIIETSMIELNKLKQHK